MRILKLRGLDAVSIQQDANERHFISTTSGIVISIATLAQIILWLLKLGFISPQVLEGILEEYYTD